MVEAAADSGVAGRVKRKAAPAPGVLGYSLLKNHIVQFDFPRHIARFYPGAASFKEAVRRVNPAKLTTLPFRYHDEILVHGVLVNGTRMTANLDTGSPP